VALTGFTGEVMKILLVLKGVLLKFCLCKL